MATDICILFCCNQKLAALLDLCTNPSGAEPGDASIPVTNKSPQRPQDQAQTHASSNGKPRQEEGERERNGGN
jgi:hypothetical protein